MVPLLLLLCCLPVSFASSWFAQEVVAPASTTNSSSQLRRLSPSHNTVLGSVQPPTFDEQPSEPEYHSYSSKFETLLGPQARVRRIVHVDDYAFAHEAPIWFKETNEVFFASNAGGPLGYNGLNVSNRVLKINLNELPAAPAEPVNLTVEYIPLSADLEMVNGGAPYKGDLLFLCQGRGEKPSTLTLMNPRPPYNTTVLLDNFYGRQFNSVNDVAIVPRSQAILFTDPIYGYLQDFKHTQSMRIQTYRFDPTTGDVRAIADENPMPNGIAVSPDETKVYIADTGSLRAKMHDIREPASIYVYDLVYAADGSEQLINRRLFAYVHAGAPDGLKVDVHGNVWAGCGDGVHVFSPSGKLLGKVFLGQHSANIAFVEQGLIILSETDIFLAEMSVKGFDLDFWS